MNNQSITRRLLRMLSKNTKLLLFVLLCAVLGNLALLIAPLLIGESIDQIAEYGMRDVGPLLRLLSMTGALYLLGSLLVWRMTVNASRLSNQAASQLRQRLFDKLGRLELSFFDTNPRGDIISRFTNDIDAISDGLSQGIPQIVSGLVTVLGSLVFMLYLNPLVTLVVVFVTPLCFLAGYFLTKYGKSRFASQTRMLGQLNGYAEEIITGQHTVKSMGYELRAEDSFRSLNEQLYEAGYRAQFASALVNPTTRFVNNIAYVLVGVFGILAILRKALTTGGLASFLTYTVQFSKPFNEITAVTMQLQQAVASARRVFAVLDLPEQKPDTVDIQQPETIRGAVEFSHVYFSYTPDRPLIQDFCLQVNPGSTVAIVGPTGSGKTTLVNLLMRFYEADSGVITVDGRDITHMPREELRRSFGMVLQDTWLFAGSLRDNIAYGKPDASPEDIEAAARAAHAHSFIRRLPGGYDAVITEDGGNLSQGQRQLLTIARAMLMDAPMLILDEATSSVDILTEMRIQRAFRRLMKGKTTFIIAHRLSTIRDADRILVLNNGNVVEQGTHTELLTQNGFYASLYNAQFAPTVESEK